MKSIYLTACSGKNRLDHAKYQNLSGVLSLLQGARQGKGLPSEELNPEQKQEGEVNREDVDVDVDVDIETVPV